MHEGNYAGRRIKMHKLSKKDTLFFLILFILTSLFFIFKIADDDTWWHLALGKYIIATRHIPRLDIFSYTTAPHKPWLIIAWLFEPLFYAVYFLFGINGLIIIKSLIAAFCICVLYMRSRLYYKGNQPLVLIFLIFAAFAMRERFLARPETFGFLFLSLHFLFLDLYIQRKTAFIIPLLINQILWVNFHASFVLGVIIPLIYLAGFILERKDGKELNKPTYAAIALFLSTWINPDGLKRTVHIFNMFFNKQLYMVRECLPLAPISYLSLKGLFVIIAFILLIKSVKKKQFSLTLIIIVFGYLGLKSYRLFNIFMLSFIPLCPFYLFKYTNKSSFSFFENNQRQGRMAVIGVACILVIAAIFGRPSWGLGLQKFVFPQKAVAFLEKEDLLGKTGGRIFNTINFGGYLIWKLYPKQKVFIDNRVELYFGRPLETYLEVATNNSLWSEVVNKYNIGVAIVRYPHFDRYSRLYNDTSAMFSRKEWALVYFDDTAIIYIRKNSRNEPLINKLQFKYLNPQNPDSAYLDTYLTSLVELSNLNAEVKKAFLFAPDSYRLYFLRAYINSKTKQDAAAISDLKAALKINPDLENAKVILKQVYRIPGY